MLPAVAMNVLLSAIASEGRILSGVGSFNRPVVAIIGILVGLGEGGPSRVEDVLVVVTVLIEVCLNEIWLNERWAIL